MSSSIRDECNVMSPACSNTNTESYDDFFQHYDPTMELPRILDITYCESCQSYSHTGRKHWSKLYLGSSPTLIREFLVRRIKFHMHLLGLNLVNSWVDYPNADHDRKSVIVLGLLLNFQAPSGDCIRKICEVVYNVAHQKCSDCSQLIEDTQLTAAVELRQYGSHCRTRNLLQSRVLRRREAFNIKKIKPTEYGMDFFFTYYAAATILSNFLTTQAPIDCNGVHITKKNPSSDCSSDDGFPMTIISLVVCPVYPDDLVYLGLDNLGLQQHMGPLAICTGFSDTIRLLNPLNLKKCVITNDDYWRNPFEPLKSVRDLVEYRVFDVQIVSSEGTYALADVKVSRESDFGKNDSTVLARTHLGHVLKPGDSVFGYDLNGLHIPGVEMEKIKHLLPEVVLVKKKILATKQPQGKSRQQRSSPEYVQFLKDLESNPEALFNLSLNGGDGEKRNSETSLEKPGNLELELENLLADLDLNDQEDADLLKKM